ncbi:hypothetical protein [Caenispirillum bisanense]|uniref:hypothetical protein n=1 Tax=Caenispirillum bisanense TaxID=414052 RepID=UPI0031E27A52
MQILFALLLAVGHGIMFTLALDQGFWPAVLATALGGWIVSLILILVIGLPAGAVIGFVSGLRGTNLLTPADAASPPVIHRPSPRRSPSLLTTFVIGLLVGSWLGGGDEC